MMNSWMMSRITFTQKTVLIDLVHGIETIQINQTNAYCHNAHFLYVCGQV
jgi:hypothetical protein